MLESIKIPKLNIDLINLDKERLIFIFGDIGSNKTNILQAIHYALECSDRETKQLGIYEINYQSHISVPTKKITRNNGRRTSTYTLPPNNTSILYSIILNNLYSCHDKLINFYLYNHENNTRHLNNILTNKLEEIMGEIFLKKFSIKLLDRWAYLPDGSFPIYSHRLILTILIDLLHYNKDKTVILIDDVNFNIDTTNRFISCLLHYFPDKQFILTTSESYVANKHDALILNTTKEETK